jgi:hypothetical protein
MQWLRAALAGLMLAVGTSRHALGAQAFDAPLTSPPLAGPLVLNGGFGEFRANHFHAGVDLGTGHVVGKAVAAPLAGWIERARASGVGYGRSIYLHADDGRLLVFGHLDAYAGALGAYVDSVQTATGQYEQDLWLPARRFAVRAGEIIAWSGESGAGGPHLHLEIRRGDMAYHPMRAGLAVADSAAPLIDHVTLEPLDDTSFVAGSAAPLRFDVRARPETLRVIGRLRASVEAHDVRRGVRGMVPWWVALEFGAERVACQFDSVSWATDMVESGYLYDDGRITGDRGLVMWAPPGFRPRVMRASADVDREAGTLVVRPDDGPRVLRLVARGVNGRECVREVALRPPPPGTTWPDGAAHAAAKPSRPVAMGFGFAPLPGGYLRVDLHGAPGARGVTVDERGSGRIRASASAGVWSVVLAPRAGRNTIAFSGPDARSLYAAPLTRAFLDAKGGTLRDSSGVFAWTYPAGASFESTTAVVAVDTLHATSGLVLRSLGYGILPVDLPLRKAARVRLTAGDASGPGLGLYRWAGVDWEYLGRDRDSTGRFTAETRSTGHFAILADTSAPRIVALRPARHAGGTTPYSRWSLRARLTELGSGIDPRATRFEVDGKPVPSEWDAEERVLRWRPRRPPARGVHHYVVVACDRAQNERRLTARFTLD